MLSELTSPRIIAGVAAAVATALFLPLVLRLSRKWRLYDSDGPLKIHTQQISRLGGVAIICGLLAGIASTSLDGTQEAWVPVLVFLLVWATGLVDDLRGLPPIARLLIQLAAGMALWAAGWSLPLFANSVLNLLCTCIFVSGFINAFNFLDGADGVAASVALVICFAYALLPSPEMSAAGSVVAAALAGCCAAFLLFNFPPARIFMGDSGSTLLGLGIAFLGLDFCRARPGDDSRLLLPIVFAALPLLDLGLAMLRRLRKRSSLFSGDRQHFYDLLLLRGWPARRVVGVSALFTALLTFGGWLVSQQDAFVASLLLAAVSISLLAAIAIYLGSLRIDPGMRNSDSPL